MPSHAHLDAAIQLAATDTLTYWQRHGALAREGWTTSIIHPWALCLQQGFFSDQPETQAALREGVLWIDDELAKLYAEPDHAWDEWQLLAWREALRRLPGEVDAYRLDRCREALLGFADHVMSMCLDMETFDGAIPNHGIWNHVLMRYVGELYDRPAYCEMAEHALERVLASQTPDGCFREGGSISGFHGTAVTGYNLVSLMALDLYHGQTGNPAALQALEAGWHWWYDFIFPNMTTPPALDCRQVYDHGIGDDFRAARAFCVPAFFFNRPEVRAFVEAGWQIRTTRARSPHTGPYPTHQLQFVALQYDRIKAEVQAVAPRWPEYRRMVAEEACMRRRNGWHVVLSGITNRRQSSTTLPYWRLERQNLINIYHEEHGLIVGGANSLIQEELSTFTFYQNGAAYYLHEDAYLKSTPPLDTLLLGYGGNTGAVSVDTTQAERCTITFSIDGERGRNQVAGVGHPRGAMAARGRLALRPNAGDRLCLGDREWLLDPEHGLTLEVPAGATLRLGGWALSCPNAGWTFRWPIHTADPYDPLHRAESLAIAELVLYHRITVGPARTTGALVLELPGA